MRWTFLLGGFMGFLLAFTAGIVAGRTPALLFRDSAIACVLGAFLMRWFWSVLINGVADTAVGQQRNPPRSAAQTPPAGK